MEKTKAVARRICANLLVIGSFVLLGKCFQKLHRMSSPGNAGPCHKVYLAVNLTFAASEEGEPDLPARHAERDGAKTTPMLSSFQGVDTRIIRIALAERKPPRPNHPPLNGG